MDAVERSLPGSELPLARVTASLVAACAAATCIQVGYWEENKKLWKHALEVTNENYMAHTQLGNNLLKDGKIEQIKEAKRHFLEALQIEPDFPFALYYLGLASSTQGNLDDAVHYYKKVLEIAPNFARADFQLAIAYQNQGKLDLAAYQR